MVKSESGRTSLVSAISNERRRLVDVFSSASRSPITHSMRDRRSSPNIWRSSASSRRMVSDTSSSMSSPAMVMMYMLRTCSAISRAYCERSVPDSTHVATQRKHAATSRLPMALMISAMSFESMVPKMRSAPASVTLPFSNAMICSSEVSALRMPPSARWAIRSSASPSNSTSSETQMAPKRDTMASGEIGRKSKRWQRERMVSGTFCGSVVHRTKTTWLGGSSSVFSSALNAGVDSM